jgi:hypothetical protein
MQTLPDTRCRTGRQHFLSAGIDRILRDDTEKNPNPWLLTQNARVQTSRQIKAHRLCRSGEERFSKNGENWVLRHCRQKDGCDRGIKLRLDISSPAILVSSREVT